MCYPTDGQHPVLIVSDNIQVKNFSQDIRDPAVVLEFFVINE